ncbi:MAG: hypothetical protein Q4E31_06415, partial [Intestinibacter bartlettii]|nr:hypothetical protein [Intestinibacter bartlettii]
MSKKRTLQNNLSYALRYMFDNYGMNIFLDSQKFLVTLDNLIPTLEEELKLVKFAVEKNAISTLLNAHNQREVDKNFAYLRAKTILTKNGVAEKGALYIIDCFLYALDWVDDFPDYEDLSDEDFKISEVTSEEAKNKALAKKLSAQNSNNNIKDKPSIQLNKKTTSENAKKEDKKVEPIHFEEKSLSSIKRETKENKNLKQDEDKNNNLHNEKIEQKTNSKYYLNHNFDNEDESDYDDDYEDDYKSGSIFKKIALILVPVIILGCIAFFMFRNMAKEAEPIVSGVSITTEYQIDNGVYVLPINKETDLNVIVQSNNSKELDLSKLSFKIDDDSICTLENDGKKCTITGLKEGKTNLVVIYNNEIIDTISLSFKEFTKDSNSDKDKTSDKVENNNKAEDKQQEENNKNNNSTNNSNTGSGTSTG